MKDLRQRWMAIGVVVNILLLVLTGWSYYHLAGSQEAMNWAFEDAAQSRQLALAIQALDNQPSQADSQEMQLQDLTRRIEGSARDAGVAAGNLVRISPQSGSRIGQTPYRKKSTQVTLRDLTMEQVVRFHHTLESQGTGLHVTSLGLTASRLQAVSNRWTVESTLTHIVYAPIMKGPNSPATEPAG